MSGAASGPYLNPGEWQLGAQFRTSRAADQYQGTRLNPVITRSGNSVISKLQILDLTGTYAINRQWNISVNVPIQTYGSSSRGLPAGPPNSPRFVQSAKGLGDLTVVARRWLLPCDEHLAHNVSLGLGFKAPTGNPNSKDRFPNGAGGDLRLRPNDPSIQLGDGGWGAIVDFQGFQKIGSATVFASALYLMNPRDENGTLSPPAFLNPAGPGAVPREFRFNTVADQYNARIGVTHPVPRARGLAFVLSARIDGVPESDLLGKTTGFRRAGYLIAVEPGLIYTRGKTTFSVSVPVTTQRNVLPQNGIPRDSTFPDDQIIASVTHRFGGKQ